MSNEYYVVVEVRDINTGEKVGHSGSCRTASLDIKDIKAAAVNAVSDISNLPKNEGELK